MPSGVYKRTEEHKRKLSENHKGMKGKKLSEEHKRKISKSMKGKNPWNKGKKLPKLSEERKKKISVGLKGKYCGERNHMFGKKLPVETKRRMAKALKGKYCGKNSSQWKGGTSCEPYCSLWTEPFKKEILERDGCICQYCNAIKNICGGKERMMSIHHIDYNKKNCVTENLIVVCSSCNSKANKGRDWWQTWFGAKMIKNKILRMQRGEGKWTGVALQAV